MEPWNSITPKIDSRIAAAFGRLSLALRGAAWKTATREGLTPTQSEILALLLARVEAIRLSTVAEQLGVTSATASDAVTALVAKGLITKTPAVDDRRALAIKLARAGKKIAKQVEQSNEFVLRALKIFSDSEREMLLTLLLRLIGEFQASGDLPALRMCLTCKYFEPHRHPNNDAPHHCHLVGQPLPVAFMRVDCSEHEETSVLEQQRNRAAFASKVL